MSDRRIRPEQLSRFSITPAVTLRGWIAALRSNADRQCRGPFFDKDEVCALGLFLELTGVHGYRWHAPDISGLQKLTGLNEVEIRTVISMNDREFRSFEDIADYLELRIQ